jgi:hypothetical protein
VHVGEHEFIRLIADREVEVAQTLKKAPFDQTIKQEATRRKVAQAASSDGIR